MRHEKKSALPKRILLCLLVLALLLGTMPALAADADTQEDNSVYAELPESSDEMQINIDNDMEDEVTDISEPVIDENGEVNTEEVDTSKVPNDESESQESSDIAPLDADFIIAAEAVTLVWAEPTDNVYTTVAANITFTATEGATVYYTLNGTQPVTTGATETTFSAPDGYIEITSLSTDGGIVTVRAIAVKEGVSSAELNRKISLYRTSNISENDTFSLTTSSAIYYFEEPSKAFAAVADTNIMGDITLKVLRDVDYQTSTTSSTSHTLLNSTTRNVTLDINGKELTLSRGYATGVTAESLNVASFTLTDSTSEGSAVDSSGRENTGDNALKSGTLKLHNTHFVISAREKITLQNVSVELTGNNATYGLNISRTPTEIVNTRIYNSITTTNSTLLLTGNNDYAIYVRTSVIKNAGGWGVALNSGADLINNTVIASDIALSVGAPNSTSDIKRTTTVQGGVYEGNNAAVSVSVLGVAVLEGGVFTGPLVATTMPSDCYIIIRSGYYNGGWETAPGGYIRAEHCSTESISDGEYAGYTKYTSHVKHTASVSLVDSDGDAVLPIYATVNGIEQLDLLTVYEGERITYTIPRLPGYELQSITYTPNGGGAQNISLTGNPDYSISDSDFTYTMTVPKADFTLKFTVSGGVTADGAAQIGEKIYDSLNSAMSELKDNETLQLLKDIPYDGVGLVFDKQNITLDLNGRALMMKVRGQDDKAVYNKYSILINSGSLTVTDTSDFKGGVISFGGHVGIRLAGDGTAFNLIGGTLKDVGAATNYYSIQASTDATNAQINISGGLVEGQIKMSGTNNPLNISGGIVRAVHSGVAIWASSGTGAVNISGGEIYSGKNMAFNADGGVIYVTRSSAHTLTTSSLNITGGNITSENALPAVYVHTTSSYGLFTIGGDAQIKATAASALKITSASSKSATIRSSVVINGNINDNAKLFGDTYAVELIEDERSVDANGASRLPSITINGGYFAGGEGYPPISDTYYVTFPNGETASTGDDLVLNTEPVAAGDYAGYYTLTTKLSLSGSYTSFNDVVVDYTYQEYNGKDVGDTGLNGILELTQPIYNAGNPTVEGKPKYPPESWTAFQTAYKLALRVKDLNRNANQTEIDFCAARLVAEMAKLENLSNLDLNNLADGTYAIEAQMYKLNLSGLSMAQSALKKEATLTVKDGVASLSVNLKPLFTQGIWGRLEKLYIWDGNTFAEASANAQNPDMSKSAQALYANWYAHNESLGDNGVTYRKNVEGTDAKGGAYAFPGTATIVLPYMGKDFEGGAYAIFLDADAMDNSAAIVVKWGTLTPITIFPTLALDTDAVTLLKNGTQTVAATLKGTGGYTVTWESNNEDIATVDTNGTITAVAAGTATITATASKEDEDDLTKTVTVTVAPETAKAASVEVATSGSTVTATLSGDTLVTNGGDDANVAVAKNTVTINATSNSSNDITTAAVVIPAPVAGALAGAAKEVVIQTDMGDVKLDAKAMAQIANGVTSDSATLTIAKTTKPNGLAGSFTEFFDISLTNGSDTAVSFSNGLVTISVPCGNAKVKFAYYINNGKIAEPRSVTLSGGYASWTTSHFSLWALSENEYTADTGTSGPGQGGTGDNGFFLADGNYYVDIALWHETNNAASMGNVAFANNRRALVTVSGGRITNVQVATNPVDVTNIHSAIIEFRVPGSNVTELEKAPFTTRPAGVNYNYVKLAEFIMPDSGQPEVRNQVTYVVVGFTVPDTPMDSAVDGPLTARLQFTWSTATSTSDTRLVANTSTAAGTAENLDTIDAPAVNLTDSATGIKLVAPESVVPVDAEFAVKTITSGADFTKAETALAEEASKFELFEISLVKDGAEVQPNGTVTISIPIPSDYDKAKVVFYRINDDATATLIKGKVSGGDYEVPLNHFSLYALAEGLEEVNDPETPLAEMSILAFEDVADHWAFEYIRYIVERGLMVGVSDTRFGPEGTMTRGMFVTVLGRIAGIDTEEYAGGAFDDVGEGEYYAPYTAWASQNGIVSGVGGGRFAPNAPITREQMATMLNNYVEFADLALSTDAEIPEFTDAAQISAWAADAVEKMAKAGIINGVGGDRFAPKNTATRAEVATLLARFLQGLEA